MKRLLLVAALGCLLALPLAAQPGKTAPVNLIFDTDIGPDYDDVGAMAVLHALADSGQVNLLGTVASNRSPYIASVLDLINTYFGRPDLPVGVPEGPATQLVAWQKWDSLLVAKYPHDLMTNAQAEAAVPLYRRLLASQPDGSVTVVTVGFFTNLAGLLRSGPDAHSPLAGPALVKQKVKHLVSMAGRFPGGSEYNVQCDPIAAKLVFEQWPTPIIFSGWEIGSAIHTGLPLIQNQQIKNSPIKDAFAQAIPLAKEDAAGRMSWDQTAVLVAIKGTAPYYNLVEGRIRAREWGANEWNAQGKGHFYLTEKMPVAQVAATLNRLMMHQPVAAKPAPARWSAEKANAWYAKQGWLMGANYLPRSAINQLEMFQAETFNPAQIDQELALAASIGFTTLRVYLHDLLWAQDAPGFKQRLDAFLGICAKHKIRPVLVIFDSCWDPHPRTGTQRAPEPGLHNPGWAQSPGADILANPAQYGYLENYVKDLVRTFKDDARILAWDVWNEPDNNNGNSYNALEPINKARLVNGLLPQVFAWARSQGPSQPLTSGLWTPWHKCWHPDSLQNAGLTARIQLEQSDIVTFHHYGGPQDFEKSARDLKAYGRPAICTEYLARGTGNTLQAIVPIGKKLGIGLINWGFADGKEQTKFPWDSWQKRYPADPPLWHHVLFRADLSPYKPEEIELLKKTNGVK
jgi:inosine-uridine nucleoside N-ribohydrolase